MKIGVIGGSGVYELEGLCDVKEESVTTPFGNPSDAYIHGKFAGRDVYFLPRHARGHKLLPSEINHKANIYGFKLLGVDRIISVSAVGSLREELRPRDVVLPDQYFDRTKGSLNHTFFGDGVVGHVAFGDPTCADLRNAIETVAKKVISQKGDDFDVHVCNKGTYVNIEGPAFSTRAESNAYRQLGFDVIGMTSLPEAKLCREAEICYQGIAMVTDYDCWRESEESVSVDMVIAHLVANTALAKEILRELIPVLPEDVSCSCSHALENGLMTSRSSMPEETLKKLKPIIGKYVG